MASFWNIVGIFCGLVAFGPILFIVYAMLAEPAVLAIVVFVTLLLVVGYAMSPRRPPSHLSGPLLGRGGVIQKGEPD